MTRTLTIAGYVVLFIALVVAAVIVISRATWEQTNRQCMTIVRADDLGGVALGSLRGIGIDAAAVRASAIYTGKAPSLDELISARLVPVIIVDSSASVANQETLSAWSGAASAWWVEASAWWVEGDIAFDDPLISRLQQQDIPFVAREFAPPAFTQTLWASGYRRIVRGHEIPDIDMRGTPTATLVARWERAVHERGIRALILTPLPGGTSAQTADYFGATVARLGAAGYGGGGLPSSPSSPKQVLLLFVHLGVCALILVVLLRLFPAFPVAALMVAGAGVLLFFGLGTTLLCQIDALLAAIVAPVYGVLLFYRPHVGGFRAGVQLLLLFGIFTIFAGLLLSALLSQPVFMLAVATFRGVKISLVLPALLGVLIAYRQTGWDEYKEILRHPIRDARAMIVGALMIAGAAVVLLVVIRSGNADELVSGTELKTRAILETLLIARPRFKEFLLGHPLLFLSGASTGILSLSLFRPFILFFGLVGQTSILNTFAHAHTPFLLSVLRTANGLGLGLVLGAAAYFGVLAIVRTCRWIRHL